MDILELLVLETCLQAVCSLVWNTSDIVYNLEQVLSSCLLIPSQYTVSLHHSSTLSLA